MKPFFKSVFNISTLIVLLAALIGSVGMVPSAYASGLATAPVGFVVTKTADTNDGTCDADCSLREAITAANALAGADTISFDAAAFNPGTITLSSGLISINSDMTISGLGADKVTVDGANLHRIFYISSGITVSLSGMTLTHAKSDLYGAGAALFSNATTNVDRVAFISNSVIAYGGGAVWVNFGTTTITNSTFSGNSAAGLSGGAIAVASDATLYLINSTLYNNSAGVGGAIGSGGTITITNSTLSDNTASAAYGGLSISAGTLNLNNSIVANNTTGVGCGGNPGGTVNDQNSLTEVLCARDTDTNNPAGIPVLGRLQNNDGKTDTIFANITPSVSDCGRNPGVTINAQNSLIEDGLTCINGTNTNNLTGDPALGPLQNNGGKTDTMALGTGSIALNSGSNALAVDAGSVALTTDQIGNARIFGGTVDMGAVEQVYTPDFVVDTTSDADLKGCTNSANDDCSLRGAINLANTISGADTITFDAAVFNPGTITLTGDLPTINTDLTISGLGVSSVSVNGAGSFRPFTITGGIVSISGLTITNGNSASAGGGIANYGTLTVTNSTFSGNSATNGGGGIYNHIVSTLTVTNSTFSGNSATNGGGGGIYNYDKLTVTNSTFSGNTANGVGRSGGGIYNSGTLTVTNSTFSDNSAGFNGGGIFNNFGTTTLKNTIVANNLTGGNCAVGAGSITAGIDNMTDTACGSATVKTLAQINLGALTGSPAYFPLVSPSAAIDAGSNAYCAAILPVANASQNGVTRPIDGDSVPGAVCDIGSYEAPVAGFTVTFDSNGGTGTMTPQFASIATPLTSNAFVNSGYNFTGWGTAIGGPVVYTNGASYPFTASVTLYAQWADATAPSVISSLRANANPTTAVSVNFTVTFSEFVSGVDITDFTLTMDGGVSGATVSNVAAIPLAPNIDGASTLNKTISPPVTISNSYTVTVNTGSGGGILRLNVVDDDTIVDMASNPLNGAFTSGEAYVINKGDTTGVFRPTNGALYLKNTNTTGIADNVLTYGLPGDKPVTGDWDGNGTDTIGIYRGNTFYLRNSNTNGFGDLVFTFGQAGDQPIAGDWNGDGIDTIGVYRSSTNTFFLRDKNNSGIPTYQFSSLGLPGAVAIAGDWNGDGTDTIGIFHNGAIYLRNSNSAGSPDILFSYGLAGDKPVAGDWNDDGIDTIGIYRTDLFYLRNTNTSGLADYTFTLGIPGDVPIAGNWDGLP